AVAVLLKDPNPAIRSSALEALGEIGPGSDAQVTEIAPLLKDLDEAVRAEAAWALGQIGPSAESYIPQIAGMLKDESEKVRINAVDALLGFGEPARKYNADVAALLNDKSDKVQTITAIALGRMGPSASDQAAGLGEFILARNDGKPENLNSILAALEALGNMGHGASGEAAAAADSLRNKRTVIRISGRNSLWKMSPLDKTSVLTILGATYKYPQESGKLRLLAHYASGGDEESETLIKWIGTGASKVPASINSKQGAELLGIYLDNWEFTERRKNMRDDFAKRISEIAESGKWTKKDIPLLKKAEETLKSGKYESQANAVGQKIGKVQG
ncbi:MAG: HEAT repeat domain-containing protein, partial [Thermodesulfobacteriota bacterium]